MRAECRDVDRVDPLPFPLCLRWPPLFADDGDGAAAVGVDVAVVCDVGGVMPGRAHWAVMTQIPCFS